MKKKSAMFLTALAIFGGLAYNGMAAGVALADDPSVPDPQPSVTAGPVVPVAPDPQVESELAPRPWLRESIIVAAAQTIGVSHDDVRRALTNGLSLRELGARHGDGPNELAAGMVEHVRTILDNWVDDGRITREEARHGTWYVESHIWQIIDAHLYAGPF